MKDRMDRSRPPRRGKTIRNRAAADRALLAAIAENSSDAIVSRDLDGIITSWNASAEQVFGWTAREAIGQPIAIIEPPDRRGEWRPLIERVIAGETLGPVEATHQRKDGTWLLTSVTFSTIRNRHGNALGVSLICRDVTHRKRTEKKLFEAVERYQALFERSLDCVFLADLEGNFLDANRAALNLLEYQRDEIAAISFKTLLSEDQLPRALRALEEVVRTGTQDHLHEYTLRTKHGGQVIVETKTALVYSDGRPSAVLGIARDITGRKQVEARIERLTRLRNALSDVNRAIVHAQSEESLFAEICAIAVRHTGFVLAWIGMPDFESGAVRPLTSAGVPGGLEYLARISVSCREELPEGRGPIGVAVREGRSTILNDFLGSPAVAPWHEVACETGIRSSATLPLRREGKVVGALSVYSGKPGYFDAEIIRLLEEMTQDVSFSLDVLAGGQARSRTQQELEYKNVVLSTQQETSLDGILVVDDQGKMVSYNRRFLDMWSIPEDILESRSDERALRFVLDKLEAPEEFLDRVNDLYEQKDARSNEEIRLKDARVFDRYSAPVVGTDSKYYGRAWYFRDITDRKRAERTLRENEARFRAMIEQSVSGISIIQDGVIAYANPRCTEIFGYDSPGDLIGRDPLETVAPHDCAKVADGIRHVWSGAIRAESFRGLRKDGREVDVGVHATLANYKGRPAIISTMQDISERKRAEEEIRRYIARLEQTMQSTINIVATIGELRDPYTHGHERRVGEIAAAIAAEMGLDATQIEGIRIAGYLHDVGKIGVPAEILSKPSRLTKTEFELVKDHAQQSYEILKTVEFPWPVAKAARQHHERLDGSGYPRGLKGDEIILEARILAIADVVEAMSSHRPYRPGLGIDKALAEIESNRGKFYDPAVADACLRLFREKMFKLPA